MGMTLSTVLACFLAGASLGAAGTGARIKPPFHYVYYLFIEPPFEGCRDCYVPMMITRSPIAADTLARGEIENVLIFTYERDSIWEIRSDSIQLNRDTVSLAERKVRWKDGRYRYQEVSCQEALRLLKNPLGTIPISRPQLSPHPTRAGLVKELIHDLSITE